MYFGSAISQVRGRFRRHINPLNSTVNGIVGKINNFELPERLKGTIIERWGQYWKNLYIDYKDVAVSVTKESKKHPLKTLTYVSILGICYCFVKHNPDESSFREELLRASTKVMLVGQQTRNPITANYIKWVEQCYNEGIIRYLNLGIFSLIWLHNFDEECTLYKAVCPYLKPRYMTFHHRVIDVGLLDTWCFLHTKMKDYDINEAEFEYSTVTNENISS